MTTVLLAEDDPAISGPLARALQREGYEVVVRDDGESALSTALSGDVGLVVLDLGLPDMDGLEVCRRLRAGRSSVPVLVLTGRTDEIDLVVGLDAGADDYVGKPFRLAELLARVRALLRRRSGEVLEAGGVRMEVASRRVWQDDVELHLSNKEFELLRVLLEEAGAVVTRERIMLEVWGDQGGGASKTLDMHVSWLRRKLGDDPQRSRLLSTVRGVGFRFERD
ncbi:MAG TPA: response regulator transcription factor [Mycobacteriales bacterium]